ncbi:MAG: VWA domain-containing protein, partial [Lachnospiraceae bacterium]|nr:VWA domain-containing protein [Lachnospiraceae bacterium]
MKKSVRSWGIGMVRRLAAVFLCAAMVLSLIGPQKAKAASGVKRHIVLVLDTSGASNFYNSDRTQLLYSADSPMAEVKEAAQRFAESLEASNGDDVYVSIISYGSTARLVRSFTNDYASLKTTIKNMGSMGGRKNMTEGLALAKEQLDSVANENSTKSVILVSPGLCDVGESVTNGHWSTSATGGNWMNSDTRVPFVYYCNAAYQVAEAIKATDTKIYGIGMMKMMKDCPDSVKAPAQLFQNVLRDISSDGYYFPVYDAKDFVFTFGQMTQEIVAGSKGQFHYASINGGD